MPSVAESFIQCDPALQHSTKFSGLDATSADQLQQSLAEFYALMLNKNKFFPGNSVLSLRDMQTSK